MVNVCVLDMSKAFEEASQYALHIKLMKRNIIEKFVNVLINWYSKCYAKVCWHGVYSRFFNLTCSVRHGGVLSIYCLPFMLKTLLLIQKTVMYAILVTCVYSCHHDLLLLSSLSVLQLFVLLRPTIWI